MKNEEHSCALRALTLCDGQTAVALSPRSPDVRCYCARLAEHLVAGDDLAASELRSDRARVVARSDDLGRIRSQRARWLLEAEF